MERNEMTVLLEMAELLGRMAGCLRSLCGGEEGKDEGKQPMLPLYTEEPEVTLGQVRAVLAEKSRDGFTAEVRALITGFGVTRLIDVDPKDYAAVLKAAEGIGNA